MSDPITQDYLDGLKRLDAEATPIADWSADTGCLQCFDEDYDLWYARGPLLKVVGYEAGMARVAGDRQFIKAARTAIPRLVAEIERLRGRLREAAKLLEDSAAPFDAACVIVRELAALDSTTTKGAE